MSIEGGAFLRTKVMLNIRQDVRIFPTRALRLTEVSRLQGTLAQHGSVASREAGGALEASSGGRAEGSPETDGWGATNDVAPDVARRCAGACCKPRRHLPADGFNVPVRAG